MDAAGIDMQVLSITAPGPQVFAAQEGADLARKATDILAEAVAARPDRFAGLAACAPQDPAAAAGEIERAVRELDLRGVIINSHTHDEYLDAEKFWPIFEAAEAMRAPIYLHPTAPSRGLIRPLMERGLDGAIYGFAVETGLHALAIIVSGAFDRFPGLSIVLGHLGEALPFWLSRIDFMHRGAVATGRYSNMRPLKKRPSDYLRENFYFTSSGMAWAPAIMFTKEVIGMDRLLYAMDYPYQYVLDEVAESDALPLSEIEKKQFFQSNAERVFRLGSLSPTAIAGAAG
jgi:2,3-dihydroxybenzoate decarboxylase